MQKLNCFIVQLALALTSWTLQQLSAVGL